jgi:hypothetical protein
MISPVGAAAGCDLLILLLKTRSKDRSLRQLQVFWVLPGFVPGGDPL